MAKISRVILTQNSTWTAPAGVTFVNVTPTYIYNTFNPQGLVKTLTGNLYGWGASNFGQVGDSSIVNKSSPVLLSGNLTFAQLGGMPDIGNLNTSTDSTTKGIINNIGDAYLWGSNSIGNLGVGDITNRSSPTLISGGFKFTQLVPSSITTYALTAQGQAYAWGSNLAGSIGDGTVVPKSVPTAVIGNLTFTRLYPKSSYCFGLTASGALYAWGGNTGGILGVGDVNNKSSPTLVVGGLTFNRVSTTTNSNATFAIDTTGDTYAWGGNNSGLLGIGISPAVTSAVSSPTLVVGGLKFQQIYAGSVVNFCLGLTSDGTLYSWGDNTVASLGTGDLNPRSSPTIVVGSLKFKKIATSSGHVLGLTTNNVLYAWGSNGSGQLGDGTTATKSSPVLVSGGLTFSQIFTAGNGSYGITSNGLLYAWGQNTTGQLATGDSANKSVPTLSVGGLSISTVADRGIQNIQVPVKVPVTPGTTYTVTFNHAGYTTVNSVPVSFGALENLIFAYEQ